MYESVEYPVLDAEGRRRWLDVTSRDNAEAMLRAAERSRTGRVKHFGSNWWTTTEIREALERKTAPPRMSSGRYNEIMRGEAQPERLGPRAALIERYDLTPRDWEP